jgi:hypothetical protein
MDDFHKQVQAVSDKLDEIESGLIESQKILESLEIRLRLLQVEVEFESEGW